MILARNLNSLITALALVLCVAVLIALWLLREATVHELQDQNAKMEAIAMSVEQRMIRFDGVIAGAEDQLREMRRVKLDAFKAEQSP